VSEQPDCDEFELFKLLELSRPEDPSVIVLENYSSYEAHPSKVWRRLLGYQTLIIICTVAGWLLIHFELVWMARISATYGNNDQCSNIDQMFGDDSESYYNWAKEDSQFKEWQAMTGVY
jgi:hypothetical protein